MKKMLAIFAAWMLFLLLTLVTGCSPTFSAIKMEGRVLQKEENRILVIFEELGGKPNTFAYSWFYTTRPDTIQDNQTLRLR